MARQTVRTCQSSSRYYAIIGATCGLVAALIWSSWAVATRIAVTQSLSPYDVTFLRFGVSALFLWPVIAHRGFAIKQIGYRRLLVMIVGAGVPFMALASEGAKLAPASHIATLMIGTMPIWVAILSALFLGERFSRWQLVGLATVMLGSAGIGGSSLWSNRLEGEWRGDIFFLMAGLLFACYTIAQRRSGLSAWHATAIVNVCSAIIFTPIYVLFLTPSLSHASASDLGVQVFAQGIAVAILAMFFYTEAIRRIGPARAAIFAAMVPGIAAIIGILVISEYPTLPTLVGIGLVTLGVTLVVCAGTVSKR